jgi:hypothetical protein
LSYAQKALRNELGCDWRYWEQRKSFFQPAFVAWVESHFGRQPLTDMHPYDKRASSRSA